MRSNACECSSCAIKLYKIISKSKFYLFMELNSKIRSIEILISYQPNRKIVFIIESMLKNCTF